MATSLTNSYSTTQSVTRNDLVGLTSISFIRPQRIHFSVVDTKPSTVMYPFFDGVSVAKHVTQYDNTTGLPLVKGATITTSSSGSCSGYFDIPPGTFNTGSRVFLLQDTQEYDSDPLPGSINGSAEATFSAAGILKTFKQTTDVTNTTFRSFLNLTTNTIINNVKDAPPPPPPAPTPLNIRPRVVGGQGGQGGRDPLAQTFFTYGVKGGCFVTAISVFFATRDNTMPITLQIRNVVNGYPGPALISEYSTVTLPSSAIYTSQNSSAATKFTFSRPIYLQENLEYCFVLMSNSNNYNVYTSEFSQRSIETGKIIFAQPYIGTLFKSENNTTWTAEQAEDIKFTIYKAEFTQAEQTLTLKSNAPQVVVQGYNITLTGTTTNPVASVVFDTQHGYKVGQRINLIGLTGATYRGLTANQISNSGTGYVISTVADSYSLTFPITGTSTSLGILESSGILNDVIILDGGSGYSAPPTITITGHGAGVQATAIATVEGGSVVSVTITNPGSGFVTKPVITVTGNCVLEGVSEALFVASINKQFQNLMPIVDIYEPSGTSVLSTLKCLNMVDMTEGFHELTELNKIRHLEKNSVLLSPLVEGTGANKSTEMIIRIASENSNVSPVIDINNNPRLRVHNFIVNDRATNSASELSADGGTAQAKYISKIIKLETPSKSAKIFVEAVSVEETYFDVYIRTSMSLPTHGALPWMKMDIDVACNLSKTWEEFKDYEFYLDNLAVFDSYDIKIVLYSNVKYLFPKIKNYRAIILAS